MAYSTTAELRSNVPKVEVDVLSDVEVVNRITEADKQIVIDCSNVVDFDEVVDDGADTTPVCINMLSQYKTAELCCVSAYGAKRMVEEQSDRQYWERRYNELLTRVLNGDVELGDAELSGGSFEEIAKKDVQPGLGEGKHGGYIDDDEIDDFNKEYGTD